MYEIERYRDVEVAWTRDLDGGGRGFGQQFVPVVQELFGHVDRVFEFCAGAGFIGFALLAEGLCDTLCLADMNPRAVAAMRHTIASNRLQDRVAVYESDGLADIPSSERWDVVVGNPPHYSRQCENIISHDPGWRLHRAFYRDVRRYLKPHASILLQESVSGSCAETFAPMLAENGLELVKAFAHGYGGIDPIRQYFVWTRPRYQSLVDLDPRDGRPLTTLSTTLPVAEMRTRCSWVPTQIVREHGERIDVSVQNAFAPTEPGSAPPLAQWTVWLSD
jgi:16S rRNA G966 N2-methylase RsmD